MSDLSKITVAILAGGLGTRLRSKVLGKPKALAEIRNHPFLEYLLHQLNNGGFGDVILCTGYLSDQIEKRFGRKYKDLRLLYSQERTPLGTGGGLRNAFPFLNSEVILVMNGDSFCNIDFRKFWQFHLDKAARASLVASSVPDVTRFGRINLRSDGSIVGFQEKRKESGEGLINAGIYLINKDLIAKIPSNRKVSIEREVFPQWIGKGFYGYRSSSNFTDIGTPDDFTKAEEFFARYKLS